METEVLYFAPGFARHLNRSTGVAVLEYARCCIEEIEGVVGAFRTLSPQAVLLWRALCAVQEKVIHVLTGETRTVEGSQAVEMLQSLSKLFRRYVYAHLHVLTCLCVCMYMYVHDCVVKRMQAVEMLQSLSKLFQAPVHIQV